MTLYTLCHLQAINKFMTLLKNGLTEHSLWRTHYKYKEGRRGGGKELQAPQENIITH